MPDYNPAVAGGINSTPLDISSTLNTLQNLQRTQAQTGLYNIQALQAQRKYGGALAAAAAYRAGQDPTQAALDAGADPADVNQYQTLGANRSFMSGHGGMLPNQLEAASSATKNSAETTNLRAQLPGFQADSGDKLMKYRGGVAQSVIAANGSDDAWNAAKPALEGHLSPQGIAQVESADTPEKRVAVASQMLAAALPPSDAIKQDTTEASQGTSTPLGRLQGLTPQAPQPTAQSAPTIAPLGSRAPMAPADVSAATESGKNAESLYAGLSGQANDSAQLLHTAQLAKSLINDPGFYSGTAEGVSLAYKKALAALGADPNAAVPQEAFRKVMATNILNQVADMKASAKEMGAGASRIFQSQIDLMEKAAQNPDNSIESNRFLTEVMNRTIQQNMTIGDKAADYKTQNGKLDPTFEKGLRQYMVQNPMFSQWELRNPKMIGAPATMRVQNIAAPEKHFLAQNPQYAGQFDKTYGEGAAKAVLSGAQ